MNDQVITHNSSQQNIRLFYSTTTVSFHIFFGEQHSNSKPRPASAEDNHGYVCGAGVTSDDPDSMSLASEGRVLEPRYVLLFPHRGLSWLQVLPGERRHLGTPQPGHPTVGARGEAGEFRGEPGSTRHEELAHLGLGVHAFKGRTVRRIERCPADTPFRTTGRPNPDAERPPLPAHRVRATAG